MKSIEEVERNNIYEWFSQSKAADRIIFLTDLIQFCLPLELRYLLSSTEHLVKQESNILDEVANKSCSADQLSVLMKSTRKDDNIDACSRSKLLLTLSLLDSNNCTNAKMYYNFLLERTIERQDEEMVLMLVMAQRHPAFSSHMRRMLKDKIGQIFPETIKEHVSIDDEIVPSKPYDTKSSIESLLVCDYRSPHRFISNLASPSPDSVEVLGFWRNGLVTKLRRGIDDFMEFKRVLDHHYGSQVIPSIHFVSELRFEPNKLLYCLSEFLNRLMMLPDNICNGSVVYEFLLAVSPDLLNNELTCATFISSDGNQHKFPKYALIIYDDTKLKDVNLKEQHPMLVAKHKSSIGKKEIKPTMADDLISAVDFILENSTGLDNHDINELLDGAPSKLTDNNLPANIKQKVFWSLSTIRKWHVTLMNQISSQNDEVAPYPMSNVISGQSINIKNPKPIGIQSKDNPQILAWSPHHPMMPPLVRNPSPHFRPSWPFHCYTPAVCPNLIHQSNQLITKLLSTDKQQPLLHFASKSRLNNLDKLFHKSIDKAKYCYNCGLQGHCGSDCPELGQETVIENSKISLEDHDMPSS